MSLPLPEQTRGMRLALAVREPRTLLLIPRTLEGRDLPFDLERVAAAVRTHGCRPCPGWLDEHLLRLLVTLQTARRGWAELRETAWGLPRLRLDRCGIGCESLPAVDEHGAQGLASLVRDEPEAWLTLLSAMAHHYLLEAPRGIPSCPHPGAVVAARLVLAICLHDDLRAQAEQARLVRLLRRTGHLPPATSQDRPHRAPREPAAPPLAPPPLAPAPPSQPPPPRRGGTSSHSLVALAGPVPPRRLEK